MDPLDEEPLTGAKPGAISMEAGATAIGRLGCVIWPGQRRVATVFLDWWRLFFFFFEACPGYKSRRPKVMNLQV